MYKVIVFVPECCKEMVKAAMFAAGAGTIGAYDCCCFETKGLGQFKPLAGSNPFLGAQDQLEKVEEYRVEMICPKESIVAVIAAMKEAHDYEVPAYDVVALEKF